MKKQDLYTPELNALLERFAAEQRRTLEGAGAKAQARQQRMGRLLPRQRIDALLDEGSLVELGRHMTPTLGQLSAGRQGDEVPGDGLICGVGTLHGAKVAICAHDPTHHRGAVGSAGTAKLRRLLELAHAQRIPMVTLADSDGARVAEGVYAISGWSEVMAATVRHRTVAPHLTVAAGLCVGAVAYNAMLADFVAMVDQQSFMFITGPSVTQSVTGEAVSIEDLGGATLHAEHTGACHKVARDEHEAIAWARALLDYTMRPVIPCQDPAERETQAMLKLLPSSPRRAYDMRKILAEVFDQGSVLELAPGFGSSLLTAFARLNGRAVAVLASQPMVRMGTLDIASSQKGAKLLEYADTHDLPVITLVDTTGYMPGLAQERGGILIEGAKLLRAYAQLRSPSVSVTLRKSYGGANVLASAAQIKLALPMAEIAPMGAEAAARMHLGPEREGDAQDDDLKAREAFKASWRATHGDAWLAAERGFFDAIIDPRQLREQLWRHLALLA